MPNNEFTSCQQSPAHDGMNFNECQHCLQTVSDCVSRHSPICADTSSNCTRYCEQECDATPLFSTYCDEHCQYDINYDDCIHRCQSNLATNQAGCQSICQSHCTNDCANYIPSRCRTTSCTLPICEKDCNQATGKLDYSVNQSLLIRPFYYCQASMESPDDKCIGFDPDTNEWIYRNNQAPTSSDLDIRLPPVMSPALSSPIQPQTQNPVQLETPSYLNRTPPATTAMPLHRRRHHFRWSDIFAWKK